MSKGISTRIRVQDGMSGPLRSMTKALNIALAGFEAMQTASAQAVDLTSIHEAQRELAAMPAYLDNWEREIQQANAEQERLNRTINRGGGAMDGLVRKVGGLVAAYASVQTVQAAMDYSDTLTQTEARLKMLVGTQEELLSLEDQIRASAERARATYAGTADIVAKMGQRAGGSFTSNDELIRFTETLNKMFVIAGASQEEQASASLQLTQALGSGVLRGEEFNAVFEAAPNIMQEVAEYMSVPIGKLRDMAGEGQITADVVKNALLDASGDIDDAFNDIPYTFGQVFTMFKENALESLDPVFDRMGEMANSQAFQAFAVNSGAAVAVLADVLLDALNLTAGVTNFVVEYWPVMAPIIYGVAAAMGVYLLATKGVVAAQAIGAAVSGAYHAAQNFLSIGFGILTGNTAAASAAVFTFNSALMASPITWIILAVIALIAILFAVVAAINKVTGSSVSAVGIITGALAVAGAFIANLVIGLLNGIIQWTWTIFVEPFIGIIEWVLNVANGGFNSFGDAVANLIGQIIGWFLSLGKVVTKIIDAIFGTDWTAGLSSLQDSVTAWGKNENAITLEREAPTIDYRMEYGNAWDSGYGFGEGIADSVGGLFGGFNADPAGSAAGGFAGAVTPYDELAGAAGKTADNTDKIAKSLDTSEEDLRYLRDIAEREAINRFTTAEIKIDMKNDMKVSSGMDLNGMINGLEEVLTEKMEAAAAGVY